MKILLATLEYPPHIGGVANYYENLKNYWPERDDFIVLDNSQGKLLAKRKFFPWLKSIITIAQAFFTHKADLVLIGQILPLGTSAALLSLCFPFRYGIFFHGLDYSLSVSTPFKRKLSRFILSRATIIICANSEVKRKLIETRESLTPKIEVINPGAIAEDFDQSIKTELIDRYHLAGKKIILSLGRLVRRKGFDRVIQSLDQLQIDNFYYLICGQGVEKKYLSDLAQASRHRDKILFVDNLSQAEKWACFSLCDIFIMPSRNIAGDFEGFGIVYLEANLMSKPVIAGASGGVADAVEDGVNGLLVNPEDNNEIAQALNKLLGNPILAEKLGKQGKERALEYFNWPKQSLKLLKILKEKI